MTLEELETYVIALEKRVAALESEIKAHRNDRDQKQDEYVKPTRR